MNLQQYLYLTSSVSQSVCTYSYAIRFNVMIMKSFGHNENYSFFFLNKILKTIMMWNLDFYFNMKSHFYKPTVFTEYYSGKELNINCFLGIYVILFSFPCPLLYDLFKSLSSPCYSMCLKYFFKKYKKIG